MSPGWNAVIGKDHLLNPHRVTVDTEGAGTADGGSSLMFDLIDGVFDVIFHPYTLVAFAVIGAAAWVWSIYDEQLSRQAHRKLLARPNVDRMPATMGLAEFEPLPRGDRNNGAGWAVSQQCTIDAAGEAVGVTASAFEWWWETRDRHNDRRRRRNSLFHLARGGADASFQTYTKSTRVAALIELPVEVPDLLCKPTSVIGRAGIARRGLQLESDEFNRAFVVHADNEMEAVRVLDADMQATLARHFQGRTIEFRRGRIVIAGDPNHSDESLHGTVGKMPALLVDATRFARALPTYVWRTTA